MAFKLVLSRMSASGLDGFAFREWLCENPSTLDIPFVFLVDALTPEDVTRASRLRVHQVLRLPAKDAKVLDLDRKSTRLNSSH